MYHFMFSKGQSYFLLLTVAGRIDRCSGGEWVSFYVVVDLFEWKHKQNLHPSAYLGSGVLSYFCFTERQAGM